jgi:hypothetical protein
VTVGVGGHNQSITDKDIAMETQTATLTATTETHAHHWKIGEAAGPQSIGVCKRCGATRAFKNWLEDADFTTNEEHRIAA